MGLLVDGEWHDKWYDTKATGGRFVRSSAAFRSRITRDGSSGHPAEPGRYHLYVSYACPWAHRTLIVRRLQRLESMIGVTVVDPLMLSQGWELSQPDEAEGVTKLWQLYAKANSSYSGRVTVPVLWDKVKKTIVCNESSEIIRMMGTEIGELVFDLRPQSLVSEIDAVNEVVYENVNDGVYRSGFATTQAAYDEAVEKLFSTLDTLNERLSKQRWLVGSHLTEADVRLFTTLVRFDAVYHGHFKCNLHRIADYPHLQGFVRDFYQIPGVAETVRLDHIKLHYYGSHHTINPSGIVPKGPLLDFDAPAHRDHLEWTNRPS